MSLFKYEQQPDGVSRPSLRYELDGKETIVFTEVLIWAAACLPEFATADWIKENADDLAGVLTNPQEAIPALIAYLQAIEAVRHAPTWESVRVVNDITSWVEFYTAPYPKTLSRLIDEDILIPELLEAKIEKEIAAKYSPKFLPEEYTRLRRLGYKPEQIDYRQIYRPD